MLSIILLLLLALLEIKTPNSCSSSTRLIGRREAGAPPELMQGSEAAAEVDVDFHGGIGIVTATDGGEHECQRRKYSHRSPFCHN